MRVFLSGYGGLLGTAVASRLIWARHRPHCLLRRPKGGSRPVPGGADIFWGDLTDNDLVRRSMDGCDAAIHVAGIFRETPTDTFQTAHVQATLNVIEAARAVGVRRFVYVSALNARPDAPTAFLRTKWEAEELVRRSGLPFTIFRPSVMFGRHDRFVNRLARLVQWSPIVPMPGPGRFRLQPVSVNNVADGCIRALTSDEAPGRTFDVGGPYEYSFAELLNVLNYVLGRRRPLLPVPVGLVRRLARLGENTRLRFPLTNDHLTMLFEGSTCDPRPFASFLGTPLDYLPEYLTPYLRLNTPAPLDFILSSPGNTKVFSPAPMTPARI